MRVLVVGCGYLGLPLGQELVRRGHEVVGVRRPMVPFNQLVPAGPPEPASNSAKAIPIPARDMDIEEISRRRWGGVQPFDADITRPEDLEKIPGPFDWVINAVSSSKGGVDQYRAVYLEGTRHLSGWLAATPPRRYIHISSTSVYGQTDGSVVTEESPTEPQSDTSRVLVETEQELLQQVREKGFPATVLRVAGIYGPGRGHLFQQFVVGTARLSGNGARYINMIHRDDLISAIVAALQRGQPGQVYNACDDEPVTHQDFFEWLAGQLRWAMPAAERAPAAPGKRALTSKQVSNRKLRLDLQCELKYPTFRQGYAAEIARLQAAGQLPAT